MCHRISILFLLLLCSVPAAFGQADYRNLDPGRPIVIEDAQPIEFRAFEFQLGAPRFSRNEKGNTLSFEPELKWGFAKDWELGVGHEETFLHEGGGTDSFGETQVHLFYNFNQETVDLPAVALRPEISFGSGALGSDHPHGGMKLIVSRSFGLNRVHLNGGYTFGPKEARGRGSDSVDRYLYGIGYERTAPIEFFVLLIDLYTAGPIEGGRREIIYDLGTRIQVAPAWVVDAGLFHAIRAKNLDFGLTFGFSYLFSLRPLFPTGG